MKETLPQPPTFQELESKFNSLNDSGVANSIATGELFKNGTQGQQLVIEKVNQMENGFQKDNALFRLAKLFYENNNDLDSALSMVEQIQTADEKTRCLVQLAVAVLNNGGDLKLADELIAKAPNKNEGYLKYYEQEKERVTKPNL